MHSLLFIQDLTIVILVAGVVTVLFRQIKQPVVLGYILAGFIIGPHTPPFQLISDPEVIKTLAELGIIFLMFTLGLHFNLRQLKKVGMTALIASVLEILLMILIGFEIGNYFGWSEIDSIFLGAMLAISSTTIIIKALEELGRTHDKFSEVIFGILIVEDILGIALLALLSSIALTGTLKASDVFHTLGLLSIFLTVVLVLGLLLVPPLLRYIAKFKSNEMTLITVLGLCFGVSLLATKLGYSLALGAFLIGTIIAEAKTQQNIQALVDPLKDLFSAIFFVSVGLLIEPALLVQYAWPIAIITLAVVIGKIVTCSFGTFVAGHDVKTSLRVGMGLAQIGEFSFIIAALGLSLKVTSDFLYPIAVTVSAITTLLTPYLIKSSDHLVNGFDKIAPRFVSGLDVYSHWVQRVSSHNEPTAFKKLIRGNFKIIVLNVILITGIFIGADYLADHIRQWQHELPGWLGEPENISFFVAMLISLPFFIVTFKKFHEIGMQIAQVSLASEKHLPKRLKFIRQIIANTILIAGVLGVALWVLAVSSTLYSSRPFIIGMFFVLGIIVILFWKYIIRIYSKGQSALEETLSEP